MTRLYSKIEQTKTKYLKSLNNLERSKFILGFIMYTYRLSHDISVFLFLFFGHKAWKLNWVGIETDSNFNGYDFGFWERVFIFSGFGFGFKNYFLNLSVSRTEHQGY